jgi:protein MAK11
MLLKNIEPTLDVDAAVQILTWDDQWVPFDDEVTLQMKAEFARSRCLGGLMVWAVSHDTTDAKYSLALGRVSLRPLPSKSVGPDGSLEEREAIPQSHWTGCRETCRSDYFAVSRSDPGAREGELMLDETGCDGDGVHTLCCPQDNRIHDCGWYTHNNGKCDNTCPAGKHEIGSNSMYCHSASFFAMTFQAACCNTDVPSMHLYTTSA